MIRILLVDNENLICQTLKIYLELEQDIEIVGTANNGKSAIALVEELEPDVVLIEIEMPEMDGLTVIKLLRDRFAQIKFIVLSNHEESKYLNQALTAGATGYLLKSISPQELSQSIQLVVRGYLQLAPGLSHKLSIASKQDCLVHSVPELTSDFSQPKNLVSVDSFDIVRDEQSDHAVIGYSYDSLPQDIEILALVEPDEFLPAVSRWTTRGAMILMSIFGLALFLTNILEYTTTVKAAAKIRPVGELRTVQAATEGSITEIKVKVNQAVERGDIIATIDSSSLRTQKDLLQQKLEKSKGQLMQTKSELADINNQIDAETVALEKMVASSRADLEFNQQDYQQKSITSQAELEAANAAVKLAAEELARYQQLARTGAVSQLQISEKKAALEETSARQKQAQAATVLSKVNISKAKELIDLEQARGKAKISALNIERKNLLEKQINLTTQIKSDRSELKQMQHSLEQTIIRASASGIVQQLNLRNTKQVVNSGDAIATIFPHNSKLVIIGNVATQDVGKIKVSQNVQTKVSACPYPDYGVLLGTVEAISPDAFESDSNAGDSYQVTIKPQNSFVGSSKRKCTIESGMKGDANIVTQKESVLNFLFRKVRLKI